MKLLVGGAVVGLIFVSMVIGLVALGATSSSASAATAQVCVTSGPLRGLDMAAATNARIITSVAETKAGQAGAVIAVMTAETESGLHVLGNTGVSTGTAPVQGVGANRDSLGLFQQRATWGSVSARLDPALSTGLFISRLLNVAGWRGMQPWVAAQHVQASAWDGHPRAANNDSAVYGGNYQAHVAVAQRLVTVIDRDAASLSCGALSGGLPANTAAGSHGLPAGYTIPALATPAEARVITFAIGQLDKPYVFDAAGPSAFDCSGLVMAAWAQGGVTLPHNAAEQSRYGITTTADALVPGDLVFVPGDDGTLAAPGHVGIYIGSGLVLNAADPSDGIRVQTYDNFLEVGHGRAALRHIK